ncbi:MAG: ATP-binding cassette domain-containing protein [Deltaproteobacteria bacterium]|nr:ATP-binding cassette domain-containing protein [Deltaproteobacteria bacterium]
MEKTVGTIKGPILFIENLSVYFSDNPVLQDVSLSLRPGEITVIVGPSGSGKSTLLRAVNRLNEFYPHCRTSGSVHLSIHGKIGDVYKGFLSLPELRQRVGMVFQTPAVFPFSIRKNLTLPLQVNLGVNGSALTARVEQVLRDVGLWDEVKDRLRDDATTLSGGQQQRLCIARMLALEPAILLLDEPTASLDFKSAARIEELLLNLREKYGILAVSHSLAQMRRIADRLCVLRDGRIVQELDQEHLRDPDAFQTFINVAF